MTSHEFHTPLNIINSSAQLLERYEWSREEQLEQIYNIRQGTKQITQSIESLSINGVAFLRDESRFLTKDRD